MPRAGFDRAGEAAASGSAAAAHRPDALVVLGVRELPVEVELTHKRRARRERIMRELVARYGQAVYFAAEGPRQQLEEIAETFAGSRVQVLGLPQGGSSR